MSDAAGTPGANPEQEHVNSWPVDELEPHSKNVEIYREKSLSRDFVESIKKRGVEVPLLVTKQGIVIDGSRRLRAAREIGLVEVPVVERAFDSELDEREAVVHLNKNRVKTFLQRMREAEELFRIEKARAKHRQGVEPGTEFAASEYGRSRDKVANEVEIGSGETLRKAMIIWEARENEGALGQTSRTVLKEINEGGESIHRYFPSSVIS
jgi:ParB/RepB/Spo0J family partition protein